MSCLRQWRCGQPEPGWPSLGVHPQRTCVLCTNGNAVRRQERPRLVLINAQQFTKTAACWGVDNNTKGTNTNRIVLPRKAR